MTFFSKLSNSVKNVNEKIVILGNFFIFVKINPV